MKKPFGMCVVRIAPTMIAMIPNAAMRVNAPVIRSSEATSSVKITAPATTPGNPAFAVRKSNVPVNP
jgi:hypothetical protein